MPSNSLCELKLWKRPTFSKFSIMRKFSKNLQKFWIISIKNLKTILDHPKPRLSFVQNLAHIDNRYLDNSFEDCRPVLQHENTAVTACTKTACLLWPEYDHIKLWIIWLTQLWLLFRYHCNLQPSLVHHNNNNNKAH